MYFKNRFDAARQLARPLEKYRQEAGVVLAVPRGGVPIGYYLAKHFGFPLELLLTKKLGHPTQPEYAIGAVTLEDVLLEAIHGVPEAYIRREVRRIRKTLKQRHDLFLGDRPPLDLQGKTLIVVDDGIATGRTLKATLKLLRKKRPRRLVVAVPVAPRDAVREFQELADDFICLHTPAVFYGVGGFYEDFSQVEEAEVTALLNDLSRREAKA